MSNHTPGPWEAKEDDYGYWGVYNNAGECLVEATEPEDDANIHLLAAAPEMKDLLEKAGAALIAANYGGLAEKIIALLRRIEGEEKAE